jgi:hypothetical protein
MAKILSVSILDNGRIAQWQTLFCYYAIPVVGGIPLKALVRFVA